MAIELVLVVTLDKHGTSGFSVGNGAELGVSGGEDETNASFDDAEIGGSGTFM